MKIFRNAAALLTIAAITGCGGNSGGIPITSVNPTSPSYSKLQFAVGTANIYGTSTGLNVVSTLRQPAGESALGVDTPAITGPFRFAGGVALAAPANGSLADPYTTLFSNPNNGATVIGPSLAEVAAGNTIDGTEQTVTVGTPFCDYVGTPPAGTNANAVFTPCPGSFKPDASTFGQSGGVFAMGLAPYNEVAAQGQAYAYAPYAQPLYDDATAHPLFLPWGGPPAFDPDGNGMGTRDGLVPLGNDSFGNPYFLGVAEGVTVFENVTPGSGTYNLKLDIATIGSGGSQNISSISQTASMKASTLLPAITAPAVVPDANGDGGATFTATLPAGVSEEVVQIVDWGPGGIPGGANPNAGSTANCQGAKGTSFAPVYYTVVVKSSGTFTLSGKHGPNTSTSGGISNLAASPTICTSQENTSALGVASEGDSITVQAMGFDYPLYEAAASLTQATVPQAPAITGGSGQADITISTPIIENGPSYTPTPLSVRRTAAPVRARTASSRPSRIPEFLGVPQI